MKSATTRAFSAALLLLSSAVFWNVSCSNGYAQNAPPPSSESQPARRLTMTECEGIDNCTTWTFLSAKGYGKWRTGEEAVLEIKTVRDEQIIILRTDVTGSKAGLTATYDGTFRDAQLGGKYKYSYKGGSGSGYWYALIGAPAATLPPAELHFCGQFCNTWRLENGRYVNTTTCGNFRGVGASVMTVEKFTRESVILHRADYPPNQSYTGTYTGQVSSDGTSLINGAIDGTPQPFRIAWGAALNSLPPCAIWQVQPPQSGDAITGFARDVFVGLAKDVLKDWIEGKIPNNQ